LPEPVASIIATPEETHPHASWCTDIEWHQDWMKFPAGTTFYTADQMRAALASRPRVDEVYAAAREFYDAVMDSVVVIRSSSRKKRDALEAAGKRLNAALGEQHG
jgi:hypothetical protein